MLDADIIQQNEQLYKRLLADSLRQDKRVSVSFLDARYPEPLYLYVKSVDTEKTIAVRIDGEDKTMRFWDYVDDAYENEDGVWDQMTEKGLENFVKKLKKVMDCALDIEFFNKKGITDDYYAGVYDGELTEEIARKILIKHGKDVKFIYAKVTNFFGDKSYVFDARGNYIQR